MLLHSGGMTRKGQSTIRVVQRFQKKIRARVVARKKKRRRPLNLSKSKWKKKEGGERARIVPEGERLYTRGKVASSKDAGGPLQNDSRRKGALCPKRNNSASLMGKER